MEIGLTGAEAMMIPIGCFGQPVSSVSAVYHTPSVGPAVVLAG